MRTCCQTNEVYVTLNDVGRITDHTGRYDFFESRVPTDPAYFRQDDDPLWRDVVSGPDGARRVLKRTPGRQCTFLGPNGCTLPCDVRPLACRLYPYQYDERGILADLASGCPTALLRPGEGLIESLGMSLEQARRWHAQLYCELRLEKEALCTWA